MTCAPRPPISVRDGIGLLTGVLAASATAWIGIAVSLRGGMGSAVTFPNVAFMWFVMMVAMMLPSAAPWFLVFAGFTRHDALRSQSAVRLAMFAAGYLAVWFAFSVAAGALQAAVGSGSITRLGGGSAAGGLLLIAAGIYQLTPAKAACLRHCRSPMGFFLTHWRRGIAGALRMGFGHGLFCLGCCWALMALAFVLGVMHVAWMLALTAAVAAEQLLPRGEVLSRALGVVLAIWGAAVVLG